MAQIFDLMNDIGMTYDGDLILDDNQDFRLISGPEWFKRESNKIIRTLLGEWRAEPDIGLNLEDIIGQNNNENTAKELEEKILEALSIDNFQFPGQFEVRVIPTSIDALTIYITYNIIGETMQIAKLVFELNRGISKKVYDEYVEEIIENPKHKKVDNKYLKSLMN